LKNILIEDLFYEQTQQKPRNKRETKEKQKRKKKLIVLQKEYSILEISMH
jgi:hypothetical protein